jgi:hypothetical protein
MKNEQNDGFDISLIDSTVNSITWINDPHSSFYCNGCQNSLIINSVSKNAYDGFNTGETLQGPTSGLVFLNDKAMGFSNLGYSFGASEFFATPFPMTNIRVINSIATSNMSGSYWLSVGGVAGAENPLTNFSWIRGCSDSLNGIFYGASYSPSNNIAISGVSNIKGCGLS